MSIDTGRLNNRRILRFESPAAALADVESLAAAEVAGRLTQLGNWPLGTAVNHLAVWVEYAFTGTPLKAPWFVRWPSRLLKKRFLTKGLSPGVKIPGVDGGTLGIEATPTPEAIARLRAAFDRLTREAPTRPNEVFEPLTHEEWIALQLRHAELHLSFYRAD